jgi:hypothetical protein
MNLSLTKDSDRLHKEVVRLKRILNDMPSTAVSRYALAEIVLIRATAVFEDVISKIAYKLACGAQLNNGHRDSVISQCHSLSAARVSMLSAGGSLPRPKLFLKWTKASYISQSVQGVLGQDSHYLNVCRRHGAIIAEIFEVRHHAAHRNTSSKTKYMSWVRRLYGHNRRIEVGRFLITTNLTNVSRIQLYFLSMEIIINDIVSG